MDDADPAPERAAVIYNPVKGHRAKLKNAIRAAEEAAGWKKTIWLETTEEDAGQGVTHEALARGATVVLAAGGDGTVRAVAEALRDSGVPIALIPVGTGNLLARNLGLTLTNIEEAVHTAFLGIDRRIDLGMAEITRVNGDSEQHVFLVMAGVGLDAKMIALTNPRLKKAVGWLAYVDAIGRSLPELKPIKLRYSRDGSPERSSSAHTVIIGNCGLLPGNLLLMPDAKPDDGLLDIAVLRPQGPFGWLKVWNKLAWENGVLRKSALGRQIIDLSKDVKDVTYLTGRDVRLTVDEPEDFQLDGDEFGELKSVHAWVDAGALDVRVPA
jgi:diacylglycerol kinase family enzyme